MTYSAELGIDVELRPGTSDEQTMRDVLIGRYHLPPSWMPPPHTVLDLGANIGLAALHYSKLWPWAKITAVEMDHDNAVAASRHFGGTVIEAAVVADLNDRHGYDPKMAAEAFALGTGKRQPAARLTMLDLCSAAGLAPVDFCKMDVEGMEWQLLAQAPQWAPRVRHLLVELHGPPEEQLGPRLARADALLVAAGYTVHSSTHPAGLFAWRP